MTAPAKPTPQQPVPPRVVLDTNIVVSALLFSRGRLAWLREAWQQGRLVPLISRPIAEELLSVLTYPKFKLSPDDQHDLLADYLPWCETVQIPEPLPARLARLAQCRDADDQKFLLLAAAAKADFLVSGDRDLLVLATDFKPPILEAEALRLRLPLPPQTP